MAKNRINFSENLTLRDDKVGIGTSFPQSLLDVNGTLTSIILDVNDTLRVSGVSNFNDVSITNTVGIGTTTPHFKLDVLGSASIGNRKSYFSSPGNLFSFPGKENDIKFIGTSFETVKVTCVDDVSGSLNNKYFTLYGPTIINNLLEPASSGDLVTIWFNVAGAGTTPSIVGSGRSVGIAITAGSSSVSIASSIVTQMSTDLGFTVSSGINTNTVYFISKTPDNFSDPNSGTSGFGITMTSNGSGAYYTNIYGAAKWSGGILAPNGKIYCIPRTATSVLVIDPETNQTSTFDTIPIPGGIENEKYFGGVLAPNGKIYCFPLGAATRPMLVIDTETNSTSSISVSDLDLFGVPVLGGVLAPNGKIYFVPYGVESTNDPNVLLILDPETESISKITIPGPGVNGAWTGGVLAPNGKIYCIPRFSTSILVIDPETNETSTFGSFSGNDKWNCGVLAPNGKIYCIPRAATSILVIDPETNTTSTFGSFSGPGGAGKWFGATLAPNGKIYCAPLLGGSILIIDPTTNTTSTVGSFTTTSLKWIGAVLAPNGKVYLIPRTAHYPLSINGGTAAIPNWYLSAYYNKF